MCIRDSSKLFEVEENPCASVIKEISCDLDSSDRTDAEQVKNLEADEIERPIINKHNAVGHSCGECHKLCKSKKSLDRHYVVIHGEKICDQCTIFVHIDQRTSNL